MREPCFDNLLKVLRREKPSRPTLFEFFLNIPLYEHLLGFELEKESAILSDAKNAILAYHTAGYDYTMIFGSEFSFPAGEVTAKRSHSLNDGAVIENWESFRGYDWPDPESFDYTRLKTCEPDLPEGMKVIVCGPGGVLENAIRLVGYENLCFMLADDVDLVEAIFTEVGRRLLRYYELCAPYDSVGAIMSNDDWGFNTQTMISPADLRKYVFPWHKKIVEVAHQYGKPAMLHSCGQLEEVMEDIIEDMKYDGKHSYEDKIEPVEDAYERWGGRIAILGGIDLDFICRETPKVVRKRAIAMLERTKGRGGYALGTGNSVPDYVPWENYFAMLSAVKAHLALKIDKKPDVAYNKS
jgi:uroporphyrinogen decarboxylase